MNSKFNLLNKTYKTIDYYNKLLPNFPNKEKILKDGIQKTQYNMIECLFAYNINTSTRIKEKYIKDYIINLSMLDYYTRDSFLKKIISKRQTEVLGRCFLELRKMAYGVIKNDQEGS